MVVLAPLWVWDFRSLRTVAALASQLLQDFPHITAERMGHLSVKIAFCVGESVC
jgi:hypothetical protein